MDAAGSTPPPLALGELLRTADAAAPASLFVTSSLPEPETARLLEVGSVVHDHRLVRPGALFVARRGAKFDGHTHLPAAVQAGAVAVVGERPPDEVGALGAPYVQATDARKALAHLAAALYRHPSQRLRVLGVTGTDGKTTTSYLLHWLLTGTKLTGLSSTAGSYLGEEELPQEGRFTTPEADGVQALLWRFAAGGATHAVLEASSHGFALSRLDAVQFATGVFTNLTPEHLDYHGSMHDYRDAKAELMRRAPRSVLNMDDAAFGYMAGQSREWVSYGEHPAADVRIARVTQQGGGLELHLNVYGEPMHVLAPLVGRFNAHNAAAALAVCLLEGVELPAALERLRAFPGVPGRMQLVRGAPTVIVDFAHTAPALQKALAAVRPETGRLIVVVGAAGERDPGKRALIGAAAVRGADHAIFTEEDSRSEGTDTILEQIAAGAREAGGSEGVDFTLSPLRPDAIRLAARLAEAGDLVLLAGKGHERTLERESETLPWDEAREAQAAFSAVHGDG